MSNENISKIPAGFYPERDRVGDFMKLPLIVKMMSNLTPEEKTKAKEIFTALIEPKIDLRDLDPFAMVRDREDLKLVQEWSSKFSPETNKA